MAYVLDRGSFLSRRGETAAVSRVTTTLHKPEARARGWMLDMFFPNGQSCVVQEPEDSAVKSWRMFIIIIIIFFCGGGRVTPVGFSVAVIGDKNTTKRKVLSEKY